VRKSVGMVWCICERAYISYILQGIERAPTRVHETCNIFYFMYIYVCMYVCMYVCILII
jgi:hypothetical protein